MKVEGKVQLCEDFVGEMADLVFKAKFITYLGGAILSQFQLHLQSKVIIIEE